MAAVVILLFVFSGGDEGDDGSTTAAVSTTTTTAEAANAKPPTPPKPEFTRIVIAGGEPKGGVQKLDYRAGDEIRLLFASDIDEHIHVHGYDLFEDVAAGGTVKFKFDADIDGVFEIELENSGVQLAQLTVKP